MMMKSQRPTKLTSQFTKALAYIAELQIKTKQCRKGKDVPYIAHLFGVASLVLEAGGSEEEVIAALFHDAVEDQWTSLEDIREKFGGPVAQIVEGCSDTDQYPKPPWKERKIRYIENLRNASPEVLLVSMADKLYNAQSTLADLQERGEDFWSTFNAGRDDQLWYYQSLVDVYREKIRIHNWMLSELEDKLEKMKKVRTPKIR